MRVAVVQRAAVVAAHDEEAHGFGVVLLKHVADSEEVAQALGHLLVVHVDEAVVHPGPGEGLARGALALGDFVLVVRKGQVGTAAVDVKALAQQRAAHGRALDMPAGPALAIGAGPFHLGRLLGLGALPEHEVERIELAVLHRHALAGVQLVERLARQPAIARELAHRVVHVATRGLVGQALVLKALDQAQHLRHIFGGARLVRGALYAQRVGVLVQGVDHAIRQAADGLAVLHGAADDLVVNIGDVAHIGHGQTRGAQPALHHVKGNHRARMAQVTQVIHGHAADIHAHMAGFERNKRLQGTRQRVVDAQTHGIKVRNRWDQQPAAGKQARCRR